MNLFTARLTVISIHSKKTMYLVKRLRLVADIVHATAANVEFSGKWDVNVHTQSFFHIPVHALL